MRIACPLVHCRYDNGYVSCETSCDHIKLSKRHAASIIKKTWRWRSYLPPNRWYTIRRLHSTTMEKMYNLSAKKWMHNTKMATVILAETFDNFQHSTQLILESRSCTLKSSCENPSRRMSKNEFRNHVVYQECSEKRKLCFWYAEVRCFHTTLI
jgi:hypothetical protein